MTAVIVGIPEIDKLSQENFDEFAQNIFKYVLANSDIAQLLREAFGEGPSEEVSSFPTNKVSPNKPSSLSYTLNLSTSQERRLTIATKQEKLARLKVQWEECKVQHQALLFMYPRYMNLSQARAIQAQLGQGRQQINPTNLSAVIGMEAAHNFSILQTIDASLNFNNFNNQQLADLLRMEDFPSESAALGLYNFDNIFTTYKLKQSLHASILSDEASINADTIDSQAAARVNTALDVKRIQDTDTLIKQFLSDNPTQGLISPSYLQLLLSTKRKEMEIFQRSRDLRGLIKFLRDEEYTDPSRHCYWNLLFKLVNCHPAQDEALITFSNRFYSATIGLRQEETYDRLRSVLPGILPEVHIYVSVLRAFYGHSHLIGIVLAAYYPSPHGLRRDWPRSVLDMVTEMDSASKAMGANIQLLRAKSRDIKLFGSIVSSDIPLKLGTIAPAKAEAIRPTCNHCGHIGHEIQQCRKLDESIRVSLQSAKETLARKSYPKTGSKANQNAKPVGNKGFKKPAHNSLVTFAESPEEATEFNDACDSYEDYINYFAPLVGGEVEKPAKEPVVAIAAAKSASQDFIQFDNGASYGLESDLSKFIEAPEEIKEIKVDGAFPASFSFTAMGTTLFGKSFYSEGARSVISQNQAQLSGWHVKPIDEYEHGNLVTVAYIISRNRISIRFNLISGVYLAPMDQIDFRPVTATLMPTEDNIEEEDVEDEDATPGDVDTDNNNPPTLPTDTNDPNYSLLMKRYLTKKEMGYIHDVHSIHAYFGHIMKSSITALVKRSLKNSNLVNHHIELWWEWFGKTWCPCRFAKSRRQPQIPFTIPADAAQGEYWEVDFLFLGPLIFLITIEIITKLTLAINVKSRLESATSESAKIWAANKTKYFPLAVKSTITSDSEKALKNAFEKLQGVTVVPMPTDQHASTVEVTNRTIRERVGSIYYSIFESYGFYMPRDLMPHLVQFVCTTKNSMPGNIQAEESPFEMTLHLSINFEKIKGLSFGQPGTCFIPDRSTKGEPRREFCLFIGHEPGRPEHKSVYVLDTKTVITRADFKAGALSNAHISALKLENPVNWFQESTRQVNVETLELARLSPIVDLSKLQPEKMTIRQSNKLEGENDTFDSVIAEWDNLHTENKVLRPELIEDVPKGTKIYHSHMFGKRKYKDLVKDKLKFRLVEDGSEEEKPSGLDRDKHKAPTMTSMSFRTLLAICKVLKLDISSTDVPQAFTKPSEAEGYEPMYVWIPKDATTIIVSKYPELARFVHSSGRILTLAVKPFYGMRGAPLFFNKHISAKMLTAGFTRSKVDPCIFYIKSKSSNDYCIVGIHVDDLLRGSNSKVLNDKLDKILFEAYGTMTWEVGTFTYLGMHIQQQPDKSINIDMAAYTLNLLDKFQDHVPVVKSSYPSDALLFQTIDIAGTAPTPEETSNFRSMVMSLMYLTNARPDIVKEVMLYSKYCHCPTPNAWKYLRQTLGYLSKYPYFCVNFGADSLEIHGYSDSSLANLPKARSQGATFVTLGPNGGPIAWDARGINCIVTSIAEAELKKYADAATICSLLSKFLISVGLSTKHTFILYTDNKAAICLAKLGEGMTTKSRHFNIQFHFMKELIETGILIPMHIVSPDNIPDIGTKPIVGKDYFRQIIRIMYHSDANKFELAVQQIKKRMEAKMTSTSTGKV
jgi:hypothetical protein